jgi:hypothetical protein
MAPVPRCDIFQRAPLTQICPCLSWRKPEQQVDQGAFSGALARRRHLAGGIWKVTRSRAVHSRKA